MEMNLALYRLPSVHRSSTSSPSGGGPSRRQSLLYREGMVRPCPACPCPCCPCPTPHRDALWVQIVAIRAVVEVDLIECLCSGANDTAAVVEPIAILGDNNLAQGHCAQELALGWGDGACSPGFVHVDEPKWAELAHMDRVQSCGWGSGHCTHPCSTGPVLEASDGHHVGPVIRLHEDASSMRTGHMEGCGAVLIGALDAGARHPLHPLAAVHAFLQRVESRVTSKPERNLPEQVRGGKKGLDRTGWDWGLITSKPSPSLLGIFSMTLSPHTPCSTELGAGGDSDGVTASLSAEPWEATCPEWQDLLSAYHPPEPRCSF